VAIPDYQTLMAPALRALADGSQRSAREVREIVMSGLHLTDGERRATVSSGASLVGSRINWATTYMAQAGLINRPKRGSMQITDRGREVLAEHPGRIDNRVLANFEEFQAFKSRARDSQKRAGRSTHSHDQHASDSVTPLESIEAAVEEANTAVAAELLERIIDREPEFLEHLVLRVLARMGYGGATGLSEHLGKTGDEGLDGVIRQDALGLDRIYVQAKRYSFDRSIGRPDIQAFVGALHGAQADRGIFITTSRFTGDAVDYADRVQARLILIDGDTLADLMVRYNVGVQDQSTYVVKQIDEDFFIEL
jgi:restriction system protein